MKDAFNNLSKCKQGYYNNTGTNVGSLLQIVRARRWTLNLISFRQVSEALGLARSVLLRYI